MMTAGRVLPISPPTVGSSAAHQTSPRRILLLPVAVSPTPLVPIVRETFVNPGFHPGTHFGRVFRVRGLLGCLLPVLFFQPIVPPGVAAVRSDHVRPGNFLEEAPDAALSDPALEAVVELVRDLDRQLLGHLRNLYVNTPADKPMPAIRTARGNACTSCRTGTGRPRCGRPCPSLPGRSGRAP